MLIIGLTILFLALIIWGVWKIRSGEKEDGKTLICFGSFFLIVFWFIVACWYQGNAIDIAQRQVFRNYNVENYAAAVSITKAILSEVEYTKAATLLIEGSVEKLKVGEAVTLRVREWRDKVNEHNTAVATMRVLRGSWHIPGFLFMPEIPPDLTLLVIQN